MHAGSSTEIKRQMVKQFTKERESWKKRGELCLLLTGRILAGGVVCLIQRCGLVNSGVCFVWSDLQELRAAKSVANRRDISSTNTNSQELFSIGSDASYNSGTVYSLQTIFFLRKLCGLTFKLQIEVIHGLIRFCTRSKISLHLSKFWMAYDLAYLSIWNSSSSLCANVSLGAGESLTIWHHMIITIPAELWGLITHFGEPLGIAPGSWDDRKRNHKPVLLPIYLRLDASKNLSRALSCLRLLAKLFWSKKCVITGIEGLMILRSVTNVTGTLFRMRNTFYWTVRLNILLASAHSTASWSSHLNMKIAQPDFYGVASFVAECLALFPWFVLISIWLFQAL